jgi:tripartite-type tricarboxylate transporter receptor subunit TctC
MNVAGMAVRCVTLLAGLALVGLGLSRAAAQDWPTHPVKIVVPYGPGGVSDVLARLTADRLSTILGQRFIVETRPGASGAIGTEYVVRSPADGYTLYHAGGAEFSVVPLMQKLSYDPLKDLTPVGMTAINGMAFAVNRDLPVHTLREFIDYARANPGKINYGSVGRGSSSDLAPAAFAAREGLNIVGVPYTATPPSILALISGSIQVFFGNVSDIVGTVRSGEVRLLAVSTAKRLPQFPDVPTVAETVPGFVMTGWNDRREVVESDRDRLPRAGCRSENGEPQPVRRRRHARRTCRRDPDRPAGLSPRRGSGRAHPQIIRSPLPQQVLTQRRARVFLFCQSAPLQFGDHVVDEFLQIAGCGKAARQHEAAVGAGLEVPSFQLVRDLLRRAAGNENARGHEAAAELLDSQARIGGFQNFFEAAPMHILRLDLGGDVGEPHVAAEAGEIEPVHRG